MRRFCSHHFVGILFPPDVDPSDGLCANGSVRVGPAPGKGLGVFAMRSLNPSLEIGTYKGEVYRGATELHKRYGGLEGIPDEHVEWQYEWSLVRQERGISVSGAYVVRAGACPQTSVQVYLDAEDPMEASWTRFLNHSKRRPNLSMRNTVRPDGTPDVRFVVVKDIRPGDELLFDYGDAYWEAGDPIDEESWDDPRLY